MSGKFNPEKIALTLSVMTDMHISGSWYAPESEEKMVKALNFARQSAKNPIDAYVFAGDFGDCMNSPPNVLLGEKWGTDYDKAFKEQSDREFSTWRRIFREEIEPEAEIIYALGNHDSIDCNNIDRYITEFSSLYESGDGKNAQRMYRTDLDLDSMRKGMRHCVCKGYHFLCLAVVTDATETVEFLKKNLDEITAKEPDKFVFVVWHYKTPRTLLASDRQPPEAAFQIGRLLENYSQVVLITGHTHTSHNNDKAIMQTGYTSVEAACVSYIAPCWDYGEMLNMTGAIKYTASEGLLMEVDEEGNLRIGRLDYANRRTLEPWEIFAPKPDKSHLKLYGHDRRETARVPQFADDAKIKLEEIEEKVTKITIPKPTINGDKAFRYHIVVQDILGYVSFFKLSSLYCYPQAEEFDTDYLTAQLPYRYSNIYKVSVTVQDVWYNDSKPIVLFRDWSKI